MITFQANIITDFLCKNEIIDTKDKEVYCYGFEVLISSLISFLMIMTLGLILNRTAETIVFFFVFAITRSFSGGYHADSYLKCNLIFTFIFSLSMLLSSLIEAFYALDCQIIFSIIYIITIFQYGPIDNEHKRLTMDERLKHKKTSLVLSFIWCLLTIILYFYERTISITITVTLFMTTMLMVIELIRREEL